MNATLTQTHRNGILSKKKEMEFRIVTLTPEWAARLLEKNHPENRTKKWSRIDTMVQDILDDNWQLTHEAIALDTHDRLIDGQNRCEAVIKANKPIKIVLANNVPSSGFVAINTGIARRVDDAAKITGYSFIRAGNFVPAVARMMIKGLDKHSISLSVQQVLNFVKAHTEAINFAFEVMPANLTGVTQAPVRAVVARAWYKKANRERLREFGDVMMSGLPRKLKADKAAIQLRNWLIRHRRHGQSLRSSQADTYAKAERALASFLAGEPLEKLYATSEELFPIPGEA